VSSYTVLRRFSDKSPERLSRATQPFSVVI
jgi:hypothetical protein